MCFKDLVRAGGKKAPPTTVPPTQYFLLFSLSCIHLTWILFNAQPIRNVSGVPCVLLSALERWNRPLLIPPLMTEAQLG